MVCVVSLINCVIFAYFFHSFILRVLPDVFVVHLPHPVSPGIFQWQRIPGYGR